MPPPCLDIEWSGNRKPCATSPPNSNQSRSGAFWIDVATVLRGVAFRKVQLKGSDVDADPASTRWAPSHSN
jgi:hypothetical protein